MFVVVAALELYGTSIGTWRWATELPGLGIAQGNPPSGVASGYVWFDVMALLVAPLLVYARAIRAQLAPATRVTYYSRARRWGPPSTAAPADGSYERRSNGMPIVVARALDVDS